MFLSFFKIQDIHSISISDIKINEIIKLKHIAQCSVNNDATMLLLFFTDVVL